METASLTLEQEIQWIEEILQEASAYGLRSEVIKLADELIVKDPGLDRIASLQLAFYKLTN